MGRCTIARHGSRSASRAPREVAPGGKTPGAINMGLADGHTELLKLEDLCGNTTGISIGNRPLRDRRKIRLPAW